MSLTEKDLKIKHSSFLYQNTILFNLNDFSNGKNEIIIRDKIDDFYRCTKYFVDNGYIKLYYLILKR